MNPDTNRFEPVTESTPKHWARFDVGEIIMVKGVYLVVETIDRKTVTFRPATPEDHIKAPPAETFTERLERRIRATNYTK